MPTAAVPASAPASGAEDPIGYVLGLYPRLGHTFIRDEIRALEEIGTPVVPISINLPPASDKAGRDATAEFERTFYVKSVRLAGAVRSLARALRASPRGVLHLVGLAVRSTRFDFEATSRHLFYALEGLIVWDHCRSLGVRRLHTHFTNPTSNVAWYAAEMGRAVDGRDAWRWSLTVHGPHDFYDEPTMMLPAKGDSVDAIICISDFTRSQVIRQVAPIHWPKVHVVRCGIDLTRLRQRPSRPVGTPPRLLVVARLAPEKGHRVLIEAATILRSKGVRVAMDIVGAGPEREALAVAIERAGLADDVKLVGEIPPSEVAERLFGSDVFCLPSFAEGLPISIMEAMAVGVPVLTTYIAGIPELVVDGESGCIVPSGRADLLAEALERLLVDDELRERIVERARSRVVREHELCAQGRKLAAVLAECGPKASSVASRA